MSDPTASESETGGAPTRGDAPGHEPATSIEGHWLDLLAFGAHPDDAEITCGGTLALSARQGYRVGIVDLTEGERASNGTVAERREEARCAADRLGIVHRENLGLPDAGLFAHAGYDGAAPGPQAAVARVADAIRRLRPSIVIAPHPVERHPDHEQAGLLVRQAAFLAGLRSWSTNSGSPPHRPAQMLFAPMRIDVEPHFLVDTSDVVDVKFHALESYKSQLAPAPTDSAGARAPTLIGRGDTVGWLRARDTVWGGYLGAAAAEPFVSASALGLSDLVGHFRRNAFPNPQSFPPRR